MCRLRQTCLKPFMMTESYWVYFYNYFSGTTSSELHRSFRAAVVLWGRIIYCGTTRAYRIIKTCQLHDYQPAEVQFEPISVQTQASVNSKSLNHHMRLSESASEMLLHATNKPNGFFISSDVSCSTWVTLMVNMFGQSWRQAVEERHLTL